MVFAESRRCTSHQKAEAKSHLPAKDTKKQHLARAKVVQVRGFSDALGNQKVGLCGGVFAAPGIWFHIALDDT
jgi:hypothetical protein